MALGKRSDDARNPVLQKVSPVVDAHMHAPSWESMEEGWVSFLRDQMGQDPREYMKPMQRQEAFLAYLDANGIDHAWIFAELSPVTTGVATNEYVAEFCAGSDRLFPVASVNPALVAHPAKELRRLVNDLGFRALKLYPTYHFFYPNDAAIYPIYAAAQDLNIPVTIHTGSSVFPGSRMKYGDPIYLDDVAVDFPDLNILMSHCGRPFWYPQAFGLARMHDNLYLELAGLPPKRLLQYFPEFHRLTHKMVFGSDWPGVTDIKRNIDVFRNELGLDEEQQANILGRTAARLIGA